MARYITLRLVNEQGTPHPWPGTATSFEVGSEQDSRKVWIGVSADGSNNQIYPLETSPVAIIAAGWPRVYQGTQLNLLTTGDDSPATVGAGEYVYSNNLEDFNRLVAACCIAERVEGSPSPAAPCMVTVFWSYLQDGSPGSLIIEIDDVEVVNENVTNTGSFQAPAGSVMQAIIASTGDFFAAIYLGPDNTGTGLDSGGSANGQLTIGPVTLECGEEYFVEGMTTAPPPG